MMVPDLSDLPVDDFDRSLARLPWTWADLTRDAREIVLYGSRTTPSHEPDSDWDLLVIGPHARSVAAGKLDLIGLIPERRWSDEWLGSGIARHVAHYGVWLLGEPDWTHRVSPVELAVEYCLHRARAALGTANARWPRLGTGGRSNELATVRRGLQKVVIERSGEPMPPRAELDRRWEASDVQHRMAVAEQARSLLEAEPLRFSNVRDAVLAHVSYGKR